MNSGKRTILLLISFLLLLVGTIGAAYLLTPYNRQADQAQVVVPSSAPEVLVETPAEVLTATSSIWMVGDVMLSRQVGERLTLRGGDFPWVNFIEHFSGSYVLANFESCFSKTVLFNYAAPFRFPVRPELSTALAKNGITHVSLANNHALDCGHADLGYSRRHFFDSGITAFGHPLTLSDESVAYLTLGEQRIALIGLHTLFSEPTKSEISAIIASTTKQSDMQVVFVHWGEEYQALSSAKQRSMAETLAQAGVDLVIGHHPHVVQPIERIGDTVVLYSLGNFIFDQYFSEAVQTGLTVQLDASDRLSLSLYPVTSIGTQNQPNFMTASSTESFLSELAMRSDVALKTQIMAGNIDLSFLATSSKSAIITQ